MEIIENLPQRILAESMRYTYINRGKGVRAQLCMLMTESLGGNVKAAKLVGDAIESAHAYSLIHDDLPCMDDDEIRRGKPCNHKVYGDAIATLAGDALQTYAFSILSSEELMDIIGETRCIKLVRSLSNAIGYMGMCGGQCLDIEADKKELTLKELDYLVSLKTGALFRTSIESACIIACANKEITSNSIRFAEIIGKAFQVTDDILDAGENKKNTYVTLLGLEKAKELEKKLYKDALDILFYISPMDSKMTEYINKLAERTF